MCKKPVIWLVAHLCIVFVSNASLHGQDADKKTFEEVQAVLAKLKEHARHEWSYAELHKASDLVVVASFQSSRVGERQLFKGDPALPEKAMDVFVSTFKVAEPLSGSLTSKTIDVVHFKIKDNLIVIGRLGDFPSFEKTRLVPSYRAVIIDGKVVGFGDKAGSHTITPEYLLFLKRRADGRYSLASGDVEGGSSVRILNVE